MLRISSVWRICQIKFILPDMHYMLHCKADYCDSNPAGSTEKDWLSTRFDQLHNIAVQTDRSHGHDNEELGQFFQRSKYICAYTKAHAYSCNDGRNDEVQDEHWKCSLQAELTG